MIEGWHNEDYLVLFESQDEASRMTDLYGIRDYLPEYSIVGLWGWDDFIVINSAKQLFTVPTVPLDPLEPFLVSLDPAILKADERFTKKVKWYVTPIVFGGDPASKANMAWISKEEHAEFVRWWNKTYRAVKNQKPNQ